VHSVEREGEIEKGLGLKSLMNDEQQLTYTTKYSRIASYKRNFYPCVNAKLIVKKEQLHILRTATSNMTKHLRIAYNRRNFFVKITFHLILSKIPFLVQP
jgi:hypothetical protein